MIKETGNVLPRTHEVHVYLTYGEFSVFIEWCVCFCMFMCLCMCLHVCLCICVYVYVCVCELYTYIVALEQA